ncbi:zinc finger, CCHC-type containing protein, partial [Tanacetum coccineum]
NYLMSETIRYSEFFEKQKLTGPNFIDWYRQLRLVLSTEDKEYYLEHPIPVAPVAPPGQQIPPEDLAAHAAWVKGQKEVALVVLQKAETGTSADCERISHYASSRKGSNLLAPTFVQNFNMHGMGKTVNELHAMLKLHEESAARKYAMHALQVKRAGNGLRKNQKNKTAQIGRETPPPPKKDNPAKDAICHQCGEVGHWRRNCPVYLTELMKKKKLSQGASASEGLTGSRRETRSFESVNVGRWTVVCRPVEALERLSFRAPKWISYLSLTIVVLCSHAITRGFNFSFAPSENKVFCFSKAEFFELRLLDLKASGILEDLEVIQEEDTHTSEDTSLNHEEDDQEIDEPQSDINPIRRSTRTRRPTDQLCLYIDVEGHELGDLGEPANYKAALLDPESKKWLDAMNV